MNAAKPANLSVDQIKLSEPEFWMRPIAEREGAFATLRRERPISFHKELSFGPIPAGPGYWALTRYADILEASRTPEIFCSGRGSNIGDLPEPFLDFFGSMINMDDPRHARLRRIVSRGFTPRVLANVEADVQRVASRIVDDICEKGSCDFVTEVAATLPLEIICNMMGIDRSEHRYVFDRTNVILGAGDPEYVSDPTLIIPALLQAGADLAELMRNLAAKRQTDPQDDLTSTLIHAEVDGERLEPQELASFFVLLVVAGNETTRNAIAHGLLALHEHPEQRRIWESDFAAIAPTAVEEIVRWATPVIHFRRTATRDAELGGQAIKAGEKVVLWYASANRDEAAFPNADRFDVRRTPNEHVGFGGPGPHFCLGAHLARREISVIFQELFKRLPDIEVSGPPERLASFFINGIKHLPASFTSQRRA